MNIFSRKLSYVSLTLENQQFKVTGKRRGGGSSAKGVITREVGEHSRLGICRPILKSAHDALEWNFQRLNMDRFHYVDLILLIEGGGYSGVTYSTLKHFRWIRHECLIFFIFMEAWNSSGEGSKVAIKIRTKCGNSDEGD